VAEGELDVLAIGEPPPVLDVHVLSLPAVGGEPSNKGMVSKHFCSGVLNSEK
jgi:hypothetical protein